MLRVSFLSFKHARDLAHVPQQCSDKIQIVDIAKEQFYITNV